MLALRVKTNLKGFCNPSSKIRHKTFGLFYKQLKRRHEYFEAMFFFELKFKQRSSGPLNSATVCKKFYLKQQTATEDNNDPKQKITNSDRKTDTTKDFCYVH